MRKIEAIIVLTLCSCFIVFISSISSDTLLLLSDPSSRCGINITYYTVNKSILMCVSYLSSHLGYRIRYRFLTIRVLNRLRKFVLCLRITIMIPLMVVITIYKVSR